jgi:predicted ester cyclase
LAIRNAFPDLHIAIDDLIAEGDQVAVRLTFRGTHMSDLVTMRHIPATGKQVIESIISIIRFTGGKVVEVWSQPDTLGFLQQLGAIPAP